MADLLGFTSIALVSLMTLFIALRWQDISKILFIALIVRIFIILIGHYIVTLPDTTADAADFEHEAWLLGQDGFFNVLNHYEGPSARFISWLIAIPYSLFGRSILMAQSISLLLGIGCIFLGWKLADKLWDKHAAKKVAWTIALFPSLVLYSVLVLREVYICFFLLIALYGVCNWVKTNNFKSIILAMIGFVGGIFFHGSILIGAILFITIVGISAVKKIFKSLIRYQINYKIMIIFLLFVISLQFYLSNKITVPYLGNFEQSINLERALNKTSNATRGDASWPEWTKIKSNTELIYKAPLRSVYFVFAPFPWNVKQTKHLIGMFDSILYMYLVFLILRNIKNIWRDQSLRIILLILLSYIFVFGIGVGNFGTGIRHRSKFVIIFILFGKLIL